MSELIQSNEIPDPLNDMPVSQKAYNNIPAGVQQSVDPIPEPSMTMPMDDESDDIPGSSNKKKTSNSSATPPAKKQQEPFNPEMNELPNNEQKKMAQQATKAILGGYAWLIGHSYKLVIISPRTLGKEHQAGRINMYAVIPYDAHRSAPVKDVVNEWNNMLKGKFTVDQEFIEEVTPYMERVLQKKGVGMSDEGMVIYCFAKHLIMTGMHLNEARQDRKEFLKHLEKITSMAAHTNMSNAGFGGAYAGAANPANNDTAAKSEARDDDASKNKKHDASKTVFVEPEENINTSTAQNRAHFTSTESNDLAGENNGMPENTEHADAVVSDGPSQGAITGDVLIVAKPKQSGRKKSPLNKPK